MSAPDPFAGGPSKPRISQQSFLEAVDENIDAFDMEPEEAVEDARQAFEAQGVDLRGIVCGSRAEVDAHPVVVAVRACHALAGTGEAGGHGEGEGAGEGSGDVSPQELARCMSELQAVCSTDADRELAAAQGAMDPLKVLLITRGDSATVVRGLLVCIGELCRGKTDCLRDGLGGAGASLLVIAANKHAGDADVQEAALWALARCMNRNEVNKCEVFNNGGEALIAAAVKAAAESVASGAAGDAGMLRAACAALRGMTAPDDPRKPGSNTFMQAISVAKLAPLAPLYPVVRLKKETPDLAVELLNTIRRVAVNDDICVEVLDDGGVEVALEVLELYRQTDLSVLRCVLFLLHTLCGADAVRFYLRDKCLGILIAILTDTNSRVKDADASDREMVAEQAEVAEHTVAILKSIALRSEDSGQMIREQGGVKSVVESLRCFPETESVQRQASNCLRNLVSYPMYRDVVQDLIAEGAEQLLRSANLKFKSCRDVARAAVRDMGLDFQDMPDK